MARNLDHVLEQLLEISASWQQLAPDDSFAGMTLAEFQAATAQSKTRRHEVMALFAELAAKRKERAEADAATKVLVDLVIHSIKGSTVRTRRCTAASAMCRRANAKPA